MYKLIIADDEARIRRGLERCIPWESMDFSLMGTARDGKEALALAISVRPHLIITDIRIPDMNGLEFIHSIRNLGIHSQIIIISGYNDFSYAQQAIHFGVSDYLLKPIQEDTLYDCVLNCMKKLELATVMDPNLKSWKPDSEYGSGNLLIQQAKEYVQNHYHENLTLSTTAEQIGVHPNYLSNLFSKLTQESFFNYVSRIRISKSRELLHNPQLKIYEVAELVGYNDYRWFSKLFKQYESVTPQQYRSSHIAGTKHDKI